MVAPAVSISSIGEYFETIYSEADGDTSRIPWADGRPHPALVAWLNAVAPSLLRCGSRVVVVGCGLGDDARELICRGYDVTAFDCSPTAIDWARRFDPENVRAYHVADVFNLPGRWRHRFDLVVEINTIQSLPPHMHESAVQAITQLMSPKGHLLVICRGSDSPVELEDGPPWALTQENLLQIARSAGLSAVEPICVFADDEDPPVQRMRGLFRRG